MSFILYNLAFESSISAKREEGGREGEMEGGREGGSERVYYYPIFYV